ncbi:MAG: RagB/SusD family nutrient uptake outer membrane protein, partial [Flavitalea sp.]
MKKITSKAIIILLAACCMITACKRDFLNTQPVDQVPASETWKDPAFAEAFVNGVYGGLFEGGFDEQMLAAITDEAIFTHQGRNINTINQGALNPSNPGWVNRHTDWLQLYNYIRSANIAIDALPTATLSADLQQRLEGEARFLRAYYYHQLLRFYGGVPIITKVYGLGEDYTAARNTYAEVSSFIITEIDKAYTLLKGKSRVRGRATDLAALALKSRQLLYDASDLHDIPTAKSKSTVISGYTKPELIGFVSGDRAARWRAARDAAKAVLDEAGSGYKTNLTAPATFDEGRKN